MSSTAEFTNSITRPSLVFRARSGSITEVIGDVFASLPSKFRRRPNTSLPSDAGDKLLKMVSKITIKDIQGARSLGGGGFGTILLLEHPTKGKVALKQLRLTGVQGADDLRRRTLREGDTWQDLKHPYVLSFLGIIETPTDLYLISPYVENGSLIDYVRLHPDADREKFLWQTAGAIAYLHKCGVVHGDIKASNILVSDDIHALLCDFGLARPEASDTSVGLEGMGTIRFQSPELLIQGGGKSPASDAWAFGMTICEVLSGNIPFPKYNNTRMIDAVANKDERPPKYPSHSPSGRSYDLLWDVATACWEKDAARRLSMEDAHKRLRPNRIVLRGHTQTIMSLAFSSDGTTIVSASGFTLRLWDVELGSQRGEEWKGHSDWVNGVACSPDGKTIVSGSCDKTIRMWDPETGCQRGEALKGHTDYVGPVVFSPDGKIFASGSFDRTLRLWNVDSGTQRGEALIRPTLPIQCLAFSPDGTTMVTGSRGNSIRMWDVESGSQRGTTWRGHKGHVFGVAFSPDGKTVASGSFDDTVWLWDVESGSQRGEPLKGHTSSVLCVAYSPNGKTIVSGSHDATLRLWDVESGIQRGEPLKGHESGVACVVFSPDGGTIASGSLDCTIRLWVI